MDGGQAARQCASLVSLVAAVAAGFPALAPPAHAQLAPGEILIADFEAGPDGAGLLFRVNPATGIRTVVSDFGNPDSTPTSRA